MYHGGHNVELDELCVIQEHNSRRRTIYYVRAETVDHLADSGGGGRASMAFADPMTSVGLHSPPALALVSQTLFNGECGPAGSQTNNHIDRQPRTRETRFEQTDAQ